jgi:hypothetical protein
VDVAAKRVLVLVFVLLGGFFAAAEIALVTLRPGQVRELADRDRRGRRVARMREDSSRFLSAVQIGLTIAGFFASSYGGATIAVRFEPLLAEWGLPLAVASTRRAGGCDRPGVVSVAGPRRARPQTARAAEARSGVAGHHRRARPLRHSDPAADLAVGAFDERGGPDAGYRPPHARGSGERARAPRHGAYLQHSDRRGAPAGLRRLHRDRSGAQRGHGAPHRGRLPRSQPDPERGHRPGPGQDTLPLPGARRHRRRRRRGRRRP